MSNIRPRIVHDNVTRRPGLLLPICCLLAGALLGGAVVWMRTSSPQVDAEVDPSEWLKLEAANARLTQDIAVAERARQVSENAMTVLKQNMFETDQQLASQREEVSFYRRLLEAGGSVRGLAVHEFQLTPTASPRVFGYRLVLTQNLKKTRRVDGTVSLSVNGISDHRAVTLHAAELGVSPPLQAFEFKYYQQMEGTLSLPAGFTPTEAVVRAQVDDSNRSAQKTYPWPAAASAEAAAAGL